MHWVKLFQETSCPLKAMLEVITQHHMMNKSVKDGAMRNGELDNVAPPQPGNTRFSLRSAESSRTQYPTRVSCRETCAE